MLTEVVRQIKLKHPLHFRMDKNLNYTYLVLVNELYCQELLASIKRSGKVEERVKEGLFFSMLECFIFGEDLEHSKFNSVARKLCLHIFKHAGDQVSFVAKILDRYLFNPEHDYGEERQTQVI